MSYILTIYLALYKFYVIHISGIISKGCGLTVVSLRHVVLISVCQLKLALHIYCDASLFIIL